MRLFFLVSCVAGLVLPRRMMMVAVASAIEPKTPEELEDEARIQRKLAAQAKSSSGGGKKSYADNLREEREKERSLKSKTKQEKREDLCELLGRGC